MHVWITIRQFGKQGNPIAQVVRQHDMYTSMLCIDRYGKRRRAVKQSLHPHKEEEVEPTLMILRQTSMPVFVSKAWTALLNAADPRKSMTCNSTCGLVCSHG